LTTFGGQTIPPIFGGGAALGLIFLRGAGAWFNTVQADGHGDTPLPFPARQVGDELLVFQTGIGATSTPLEIAEWTAFAGTGGGSLNLWHRIATNDASDTFTIRSTFSGNSLNQMASFGNLNQLGLTGVASGTLTTGNSIDWDILTMAAGAIADTMALAFFNRVIASANVGLSVTDNTGLNLIGSQFQNAAGRTSWCGWSWRFDAVAASTPTVEQGYTPDPVSADQITRYFRFVST
jgi:hypothetical protein